MISLEMQGIQEQEAGWAVPPTTTSEAEAHRAVTVERHLTGVVAAVAVHRMRAQTLSARAVTAVTVAHLPSLE
jgi:hypothetical protein